MEAATNSELTTTTYSWTAADATVVGWLPAPYKHLYKAHGTVKTQDTKSLTVAVRQLM